MSEPEPPAPAPAAHPSRRPPPRAGPGRNKSFRKAREQAAEAEEATATEPRHGQYLDVSLEDVQKYFSPETWRKMAGMNLHSVSSSSVQKYFDPVAWEKLQRLGCLRGRPSSTSSTSTPPSPTPVSAAKGCFSPRSWEALTRLNVVPAAAPQSPQSPRGVEGEDATATGDDDDGFLEHGMGEDCADDTSLSSAVRLYGLEGEGGGRGGQPRAVADGLRLYFSLDQWKKLQERGVLQSALSRLAKETSV